MKTLGVSIDGVLRNYLERFDIVYRKTFIHNPNLVGMGENNEFVAQEIEVDYDDIEKLEAELIKLPIDSPNLLNHYQFREKVIDMTADDYMVIDGKKIDGQTQDSFYLSPQDNLNKFMFEEYPFQIFGQADEFHGACDYFNKIQAFGLENGFYETVLMCSAKHKAIPATYFFLSKLNCRARRVIFVNEEYEMWDHCDVLITADAEALQAKPKNKKSIKINQLVNKLESADHDFNNLNNVYNPEFLKSII